MNADFDRAEKQRPAREPPRPELGETSTLLATTESTEIDGLGDAEDRDGVVETLFQAPAQQQLLGRYVVLGTLGTGGMGTVFEAFDRTLDRRVAVKVLHEELDERHTTRLIREAQAMAKLSHPNVVQVYEAGQTNGQTFVAMELVEGETLHDWMRREPRPDWRRCLEVFHQVGKGLAAAHARGLVHRDFKPANTIVDAQGRPRVLDFGLVRQVGSEMGAENPSPPPAAENPSPPPAAENPALDTPLTRTGTMMGTPAYMPPEQMNGARADARSDQFSFCVSLYEAVYGERPFAGNSLIARMESIASGNIRPAPKGTQVPIRLYTVLRRGLANDPEQRWSTMDDLLEMLAVVLETHDKELHDPDKRQSQRRVILAVSTPVFTLLGLSICLAYLGIGIFSPIGAFLSHLVINVAALIMIGSLRAYWNSSRHLRRIVIVFTVVFVAGIACHGTAMLRGNPLEVTLAFELLMMTAFGALAAALVARWFWVLTALYGLGWLASLLVVDYTNVFFMIAIMLGLIATSLALMKPAWNVPVL